MNDEIKRSRDAIFRRRILRALNECRDQIGINGAYLLSGLESSGRDSHFESDKHFMQLVSDLVGGGYVIVKHLTRKKWQSPGPDFVRLSITAMGTALIEEKIAPDPLIEDERIMEEE